MQQCAWSAFGLYKHSFRLRFYTPIPFPFSLPPSISLSLSLHIPCRVRVRLSLCPTPVPVPFPIPFGLAYLRVSFPSPPPFLIFSLFPSASSLLDRPLGQIPSLIHGQWCLTVPHKLPLVTLTTLTPVINYHLPSSLTLLPSFPLPSTPLLGVGPHLSIKSEGKSPINNARSPSFRIKNLLALTRQ